MSFKEYSSILLIQLTRAGQVLNYQIFRIIKQYLYQPKFLQVIFCYCSYPVAVQLIGGVFQELCCNL